MATERIHFEIEGEQELNNFFHKSLTDRQQRSVEISTYKRLARPIIRSARTKILPHKMYGTLARSLQIYPFRKKTGIYVGAKRTGQLTRKTDRKTFKGIDGFYAGWVDRGTKGRKGLDFWGPSVRENFQNIGTKMQEAQVQSLSKYVSRTLKKRA